MEQKLGKYESPKVKKAWKASIISVSILLLVPCLALMTFGVLHLAGVISLSNDSARVYTIVFRDGSSDKVYFEATKTRGEKFEYTYTPTKKNYKFRGWDINGDNIVDSIPRHVYKNIDARALWAPIYNSLTGGNHASH